MKYDTINDAAHEWVRGMNAIPQDMIAALMKHDFDSWSEVTTLQVGQTVYVDGTLSAEVLEIRVNENDEQIVKVNVFTNGEDDIREYDLCEVERTNYDDILPMWGTMWSFGDSADDYWLEELDGIRLMSECGFRIYEHDEWGYFFGVDGAGYDFYEAHWIPLYKARGLHWHKEEE